MLVSDLYTKVGYRIGDPSALRNTLILSMANDKLQELARRYKCKFNLRKGTITTLEPDQTTTYRARSSNVATITTASAHGYRTGEYVKVSSMGSSVYDDASVVIASVPSTTTFTYANTGDNESATADTAGTVTLLGRVEYNAPEDFYKPVVGYEIVDDNYLKHISYKELRRKYPDFTEITNDSPEYYAVKSISYVDNQPFSSSKVACATTETITLRIRGLVSGVVTDESVSCTSGSTNSSNTYDADGLISITAATAPTATITCTTNSSLVTVQSLAIGQQEKQRVRIVVYPPVDDGRTLYYDYYVIPKDLSNAYDRVPIPIPYGEWLVDAIAAEILTIDGRKEADRYLQLAERIFQQMTDDDMIEPDEDWSSWPVNDPEDSHFGG